MDAYRLESARKRMAVPFRAARTPSERSEFAQPDVSLLLTTLAYYHDGLSREEVVEALTRLLALGESARNDRYNDWYRLSMDMIEPGNSLVTVTVVITGAIN